MTITVVNKKTRSHVVRNEPWEVYIGRPGILGNPYSHLPSMRAVYTVPSRDEAVVSYAERAHKLMAMPTPTDPTCIAARFKRELTRLGRLLKEYGELTLICWCAGAKGVTTKDRPYVCHGQVIAELLEQVSHSK